MIFDIETILPFFVVTAVAVWGLMEVVKSFFRGWRSATPRKDRPWYWSGTLRLLSVIFGGLIGCALSDTALSIEWQWGTAIGICAGALSAIVTALVKKQIASRLRVKDDS